MRCATAGRVHLFHRYIIWIIDFVNIEMLASTQHVQLKLKRVRLQVVVMYAHSVCSAPRLRRRWQQKRTDITYNTRTRTIVQPSTMRALVLTRADRASEPNR